MQRTVFCKARDEATTVTTDPQELNRLWWESMPMTYAGWEEADRLPGDASDFACIDRRFLEGNPWLATDFDFTAFRGRRVLEIGCGSGTASCLLARAGASVSAIDLTEQAVGLARVNARAQGLEIDVRRMDAESLDFPERSFDYVFSWGVIHHSRSTESIVREIARVLRPGGGGMCMVYNRASLRYYLHGAYWLLARGQLLSGHTLKSVQQVYTDGYFQRHFTPGELERMFEAEGLRRERISITHMAGKLLPLLPPRLDAQLKKSLGWLLVIEFAKPDDRSAPAAERRAASARSSGWRQVPPGISPN